THSILMFAALMILPYLAISSAMYLEKYSEVEPIGSKPRTLSRSFISGVARMLAIAAWSLAVMSAGRPFGPHKPYHDTNSNSFIPDSSTVGISGAAGWRVRLVIASALIFPALASGNEESIGSASS